MGCNLRIQPADLTPDQRLDELAVIFATGVRRALSVRSATSESPENGLEQCPETRLHGPGQLTETESAKGDTQHEA